MSTEPGKRHESVIQIAMILAEKNGYPVDAWRLFEARAEATLTRMSAPTEAAPSISPEHHHDQLDDAQLVHPQHPHVV